MQVIHLAADEDFHAIAGRLKQAAQADQIVLVLPDRELFLAEPLDLVRLRRLAEELSVEIGLVTLDADTGARAKSLGFPVFAEVKQAEGSRRWRRARRLRRRPTRPGGSVRLADGWRYSSLPSADDRAAVHRRIRPRPPWARWLSRYFAVIFFSVAVTLLAIALLYTLPGATLVLQPETRPVNVEVQIVADPQLETINLSGASAPGRLLVSTNEWRAAVETTGLAGVPDGRAAGSVVFVNLLDQPVTVPAGTRLSTSAGERIIFQVVSDVEVPAGVGSTVEADIVAVEPGEQGNVAAFLINRIEGSLANRLQVRNLEELEGGTDRMVSAVTEADLERLHAQVMQYLFDLALADMETDLAEDEFLATDSLRLARVYEETYSHFAGDRADQVTLELRAEIHGTAIQAEQAYELVYVALLESVEPGFELVPRTVRLEQGELVGVDGEGRVSFLLRGEALTAATLDLEPAIAAVAGQEKETALSFLEDRLPLSERPNITIRPEWFNRLPYLPVRIQFTVEYPD